MSKKIIPVVLAVIKHGNKFLVTKRVHSDKRFHDKWQLPGGELEFGEKLEEALTREIKEELNAKIKILKFLGNVYTPIRHNWHGILFPFLCELKSDESKIRLDHEASAYKWYTKNELSKLDILQYTLDIVKLA